MSTEENVKPPTEHHGRFRAFRTFVFGFLFGGTLVGGVSTVAWNINQRRSHIYHGESIAETLNRAVEIEAALEEYHDDNEKYPPDLESVVRDYLAELVKPSWGTGGWWYISTSGKGYEFGYLYEEGSYEGFYQARNNRWAFDH